MGGLSTSQLLSQVGGGFGLCTGLSILSLSQFLFYIFYRLFRRRDGSTLATGNEQLESEMRAQPAYNQRMEELMVKFGQELEIRLKSDLETGIQKSMADMKNEMQQQHQQLVNQINAMLDKFVSSSR